MKVTTTDVEVLKLALIGLDTVKSRIQAQLELAGDNFLVGTTPNGLATRVLTGDWSSSTEAEGKVRKPWTPAARRQASLAQKARWAKIHSKQRKV